MSSGNMISVENDSLSRNRIVSEIDRNFFVEAGAGSGKTSMLVRRMVAMVEAGKPISKISAITFTKAAAGEFYDRFQKLLIERSNPNVEWKDMGWAGQLPKPTEETRRRCADALQDIDLCFMGTIDAFCFSVLSEHPYEAGIPSDAKIISDPDEETVFRQEYVKIINAHGGQLKDAIGVPEDQLRQAARSAVCKINVDSDLRLGFTAGIRQTFDEHPDMFDPRGYLKVSRQNVHDIVKHKIIDVLGSANKM